MTATDRLRNLALGAVVEHLRVKRGLTQAALAARLAISQPALSRVEAGTREMSVTLLCRLAKAFRRPVASLYACADEVVRLSERAANAIKPGSLRFTDPAGIVRFVVAAVEPWRMLEPRR